MASSLSKLSLEPNQDSAPSTTKSKETVADSWEDEDLSDSGDDTQEETTSKPVVASAPRPTSVSPTYAADTAWTSAPDSTPASPRATESARRPEKTDAVARRMIAAGLGLKAPKQTDEQKAYQRAVREKEKKKREDEKRDEHRRREEAAKAKASVWED